LVQAEGEVEALGVIVTTSVLDGEGVASEPLDGVLLCIVLGDSQRLEFLWEEEVTKSSREGGKPSLSLDIEAFLHRSSSIFWRAS
jgi:hypothetical protein